MPRSTSGDAFTGDVTARNVCKHLSKSAMHASTSKSAEPAPSSSALPRDRARCGTGVHNVAAPAPAPAPAPTLAPAPAACPSVDVPGAVKAAVEATTPPPRTYSAKSSNAMCSTDGTALTRPAPRADAGVRDGVRWAGRYTPPALCLQVASWRAVAPLAACLACGHVARHTDGNASHHHAVPR